MAAISADTQPPMDEPMSTMSCRPSASTNMWLKWATSLMVLTHAGASVPLNPGWLGTNTVYSAARSSCQACQPLEPPAP